MFFLLNFLAWSLLHMLVFNSHQNLFKSNNTTLIKRKTARGRTTDLGSSKSDYGMEHGSSTDRTHSSKPLPTPQGVKTNRDCLTTCCTFTVTLDCPNSEDLFSLLWKFLEHSWETPAALLAEEPSVPGLNWRLAFRTTSTPLFSVFLTLSGCLLSLFRSRASKTASPTSWDIQSFPIGLPKWNNTLVFCSGKLYFSYYTLTFAVGSC